MTSPLEASGANYPCKGYLGDLSGPGGASVASFAQGGKYNFTVQGTAVHGGGSCQALLSYDGGKSFKVLNTIIGNCPVAGSGNFDFDIPGDAPAGNAVFAWTWFNNLGNREMYMNCASVTITGGGGQRKRGPSFDSRPSNFIANVGNGCSTSEGKDLNIPNPGPDVLVQSSNVAPPVGSCEGGPGAAPGGGGNANPSPAAASSAAASSAAASPSAGANGADGAPGKDGADGAPGAPGAAGANGPSSVNNLHVQPTDAASSAAPAAGTDVPLAGAGAGSPPPAGVPAPAAPSSKKKCARGHKKRRLSSFHH
ncbi:hypothetical protein Q8F55_007472 [Vanrija albida]|uniref:Chitin-binding type-4 domain-containing protein n=1 Tax=Vanrija albida TaxID=181172 RepID=A0ABR3PTW7_9TREE